MGWSSFEPRPKKGRPGSRLRSHTNNDSVGGAVRQSRLATVIAERARSGGSQRTARHQVRQRDPENRTRELRHPIGVAVKSSNVRPGLKPKSTAWRRSTGARVPSPIRSRRAIVCQVGPAITPIMAISMTDGFPAAPSQQGMHCRLTFLGSMNRIDPRRSLPGARVGCCHRDDKPREADELLCGASER